MENASNALIIAAGVLIGILVLSLAVYLFTSFGANSAKIQEDIEFQKIIEFNAQFNIYEGEDTDITIHDVITVYNLANENNEYYENFEDYENNYKITVTLSGNNSSILNVGTSEDAMEKYISGNNLTNKYQVKKNSITYHNNGRISTITFEPKN